VQYQSFRSIVSAILQRNLSHFTLQIQPFKFAISALLARLRCLVSPDRHCMRPQENVFRFRLHAKIQNFASDCKTFADFFDRYDPQCFLSTKAEMPTTTKIKTFLRRNGDDGDSFYFFFFVFLFSCSLFFRNITN